MATFSLLSLGTRRDAKQFQKGATETLNLAPGTVLIGSKPSLNNVKGLFGRSDDVLFLAGHFISSLHNDDHSVELTFDPSKLTIKYENQISVLNRGAEFKQTSCKLVIWGGCSICSDTATITAMRTLFGPHVLIGWIGQTGWEITDIMFGGKGHGSADPEPQPNLQTPNYFAELNGVITDPALLWKAWLKVAKALSWGNDPQGHPYLDRFCAVDINGTKHVASELIA